MTAPSNANTSGLAPCPFCGGEAEQFEMAGRSGVRCADVMCAGSHRLPADGEDYVAAWNRRHAFADGSLTDRLSKAMDEALIYIEALGKNIERNDVDMHLDAVERPFSFAQNLRSQFPELCAALQQEG